jgi:hypothetical protein
LSADAALVGMSLKISKFRILTEHVALLTLSALPFGSETHFMIAFNGIKVSHDPALLDL